jgi:hypothetical protein
MLPSCLGSPGSFRPIVHESVAVSKLPPVCTIGIWLITEVRRVTRCICAYSEAPLVTPGRYPRNSLLNVPEVVL